jgi:chemotaxis protein CheD
MLPKSDGVGPPEKYADTGLVRLIRAVAPDKAAAMRLRIVACGGSTMYEDSTFRIGPRNIAALKQFLWNMGLTLAAQDLGGTEPRTARIDLEAGTVSVDGPNTAILWELA